MLNKTIESLTKELDGHRSDVEALQNLLRDRTAKEKNLLDLIDKLKQEISDSTNAALTSSNEMLEERTKLELQIKEILAEKENISTKNEELIGKLNALSNNLSTLAEEKKDVEEKLEHSSKLLSKYKNAEYELNILRQENNALKLEQTKTNGVLAKLNQERDANELKHGQRTALVGMLEEQVADLNDSLTETKAKLEAAIYDLSQKDEEIETITTLRFSVPRKRIHDHDFIIKQSKELSRKLRML